MVYFFLVYACYMLHLCSVAEAAANCANFLMQLCWQPDYRQRPKFPAIVDRLQKLLTIAQLPELIDALLPPRRPNEASSVALEFSFEEKVCLAADSLGIRAELAALGSLTDRALRVAEELGGSA